MKPLPGDAQLWRYMSLAAFIQILQMGSMFFPRTKKVEDPYESAMLSHSARCLGENVRPQTTGGSGSESKTEPTLH